ncbi:hypothetical protein PPROV_000696200 [Pycnococcus provasolii]|uniref:S-acyltransferase n=1 Tax=Pycnococcus provasolii TaxID=41880 RepID=A0A830HRZ4_9CHLO|nr:hypothetical protein PPROV_000696200 [Pycnococcus provasolii]
MASASVSPGSAPPPSLERGQALPTASLDTDGQEPSSSGGGGAAPPPPTTTTTAQQQQQQREVTERVYMSWPGSETFFCGGRCVSGPDWRNAFATAGLILVPTALFCAFVAPVYIDEVQQGWLVAAAAAVWASMTVTVLMITACTDPGILPRRDPARRLTGVPQQRHVAVNGVDVVINLNRTCGIYQPPRAHHCSVNDDCIEKFDHHCPWVGNTVGLRNYRYFLAMIFSLSLLLFFVLIASCVGAFHYHYANVRDDHVKSIGDGEPTPAPSQTSTFTVKHGGIGAVTIFLIILCTLTLPFVGGLTIFHLILVSRNQTTYENFKANAQERSAYDIGCLRNWYSVFCTPVPATKVKFRDPVHNARASDEDDTGDASNGDASNGGMHSYPSSVSLPNAATMRDAMPTSSRDVSRDTSDISMEM